VFFRSLLGAVRNLLLDGIPGSLSGCRDASNAGDDKRHTRSYHEAVKPFRWNPDKNEALQISRGVSFEIIVVAIGAGGLLDILMHPNQAKYPQQRVLVVAVDGYAYLVPFVEEDEYLFLKTVIPSRKATRDYLQGAETDDRD
jgi:hypothetical protein